LIIPTLVVVLPVLLTGTWDAGVLMVPLLASMALGAAGTLGAVAALFPGLAAAFRDDPTPEQAEEAEGILLFLTGCLIAAVPLGVLWIVYQGSGWVIGC
jgi:hypothetical protein